MKKRPSNILMQVVLGIIVIFVIYVIGGLFIRARRQVNEEPDVTWIHEFPITASRFY
ncbi:MULTISPECIES: hypothetical protein [unclassified Coleofasciculus]|uniref:hypothetical protein n=1 Tax=unclassified Coleofasciculus TaxID=2692782 RepID=UPI001880655A|nr:MULTISPECIES: hypothetical protein [unclassified Coleofasciculus]MBE9126649.1 hypothetical protein [Coleofasciculus sp. LEGE 07081]MBE9148491.1 hypothetical protein [Coleofasciculus sp. LEGE 07092]